MYTDNITNEVQTFEPIAYTNGLPSGNYQNSYTTEKNNGNIKFLLQITKLSNNDKDKIKETYLQAYYTNDVKLKIRFSKVIFPQLVIVWDYFGNDKDIILDVYNPLMY
ncbi:hypothetical protein [Spiroplasma sp. ald]|uniref:hypothetical protein n=1 Tax=Spiroplasma sp. ald TaxID=2490849 RepID=UPI0037DD673B